MKKTQIRFLRAHGANKPGDTFQCTTAEQIATAQRLADGGIVRIDNPTLAETTPSKRIEAGKEQAAVKAAKAAEEAEAAAAAKAAEAAKEKESSATFQKAVEAEQDKLSEKIEAAKPKRKRKKPAAAE